MDRYNITKDILGQLTSKVSRGHAKEQIDDQRTQEKNSQHHMLVVFTGTDVGVDQALSRLVKSKSYGFTFDVALSFTGMYVNDPEKIKNVLQPNRIYTEEDWQDFGEILESVDGIIAPMITQDTTAKLSLGIQDDFISTLLWQALWHGKALLMDFENVVAYRGTKSHNPLLQQMMDGYVDKLQKMGVTRVDRKNYIVKMLAAFENENSKNPDINAPELIGNQTFKETKNKQVVITEKDLANIDSNTKEITVPARAIVTPLAYDRAKEIGIKIIKMQG